MKMLLDFLYPKTCPGCDNVFGNGATFCKSCAKKIIYINDSYCLKCGKPIVDKTKEMCFDCAKRRRIFDEHRAAYVYKGAIKHGMYMFKYSNKRCYGALFARDLVLKNYEWLNAINVDAIVPIPMYRPKQKKRGYNQAEILANVISKMINVPVDKRILQRCKNTLPMKNLNDAQRRINLENAFICKDFNVEYSRLLLIDDIFTTGATFDSAAAVVKAHGVKKVYCISVCVGMGS